MEITLINQTNEDVEQYLPFYETISEQARKVLDLTKEMTISVTFLQSDAIHVINRQYRGIDRPTDVISFAVNDEDEGFDLPLEEIDLGDIFINIDYAKKQAEEYGHSYKRELGFLFTHGLLHCLGYDHMVEEDEKVMFALQDEILNPIVSREE